MGRQDWDYVNMPKLLVKRLEQFLQTPGARSMGIQNKAELLRRIINEFLDEQEAFYNNIESISDFITQVKDRDHIIVTYNEDEQFQEIVCKFVERGIKNNEINVLSIFREEEQRFIKALEKGNINTAQLFNRQDLTIISADDCFYGSSFSVEPFARSLDQVKELAKKMGKSGLNIISTTPGNLAKKGRYEDAVYDEHSAHKLVAKYDMPTAILCLYTEIPQQVEQHLLEFHDVVIKHAVVEKKTGLQ